MKMKLIIISFIFLCANLLHSQEITMETLLNEMIDRETIVKYPSPLYKLKQFSSYDRLSQNPADKTWYSNGDSSNYLYTDGNEKVMFESNKPGVITRFWFTVSGYTLGNKFRIYIDDELVLEGNPLSLIGNQGLVPYPLSSAVPESAEAGKKAYNLYLPIPYQKSCKITFVSPLNTNLFYNINYREYPLGTKIQSFKEELAKTTYKDLIDKVNEILVDSVKIIPEGEREVGTNLNLAPEGGKITKTITGPKAIHKIQLKINAGNYNQALRSTILKIKFDGKETVWAPIGDFFGTGYKLSPYSSWYSDVDKEGTMTCYWVMPFSDNCELSIENLSSQEVILQNLEILAVDRVWNPEQDMYFGAGWFEENKMRTHKPLDGELHPFDLNMVTLTGKGVLVGSGVTLFNAADAWWGEGDEKIYVDNEVFPSHFGTGTEDYYGYAWCLPNKFTHPFIAQPDGSGNLTSGHSVNLRHRVLDAIPFTDNIKADIEIWHWAKTRMNYAPVSYYYLQTGTSNLGDNSDMARKNVALNKADVLYFPDLDKDGYVEFENLSHIRNGGWLENQYLPQISWREEYQSWWLAPNYGQYVEYTFRSSKKGRFPMKLGVTIANDYSSYDVYVNDKHITTFDAYNQDLAIKELELQYVDILQGDNKIKFIISGKNNKANSIGVHAAGFDYLQVDFSSPEETSFKDGYAEFENMTYQANGGWVRKQMNGDEINWHEGYQSWWNSPYTGNSVEYTFRSLDEGRFPMKLGTTIAKDYSSYEIYVNGKHIQNFDAYNPEFGIKELDLQYVNILKGDNKVKFVITGKNSLAAGAHMAGFDYLYVDFSKPEETSFKEGYIEFENMDYQINGGWVRNQKSDALNWQGDYQSWWIGPYYGEVIEYAFLSSEGGSFPMKLGLTVARDYSTYNIYLNDEYITAFDAYSSSLAVKQLDLQYVDLLKGINKIKFVITGKNYYAGYGIHLAGFDYLYVDFYKSTKETLKSMKAVEAEYDFIVINKEGYIEISSPSGIIIEKGELYNTYGRLVDSSSSKTNYMKLGNYLTKGVYILKIISVKGEYGKKVLVN